eukprot:TRINITY_DN7952_c0_g1_i1.p1 TRINITY_DN7952_c0_g1~~TRINITY_DN7952_c0_g1_i1.p1  ORF type:complete len:136 (-),score=23.10 TRINITY_DN7952_c0_g1_i1:224-631(-)
MFPNKSRFASSSSHPIIRFQLRFQEMKQCHDTYYNIVVEDLASGKIVGAASLIVERKIVRNLGKCGHIEDVVIDDGIRGKNLGKRMMDQLLHVAAEIGCYKVILDCSDKNVAFYEKCGFHRKEVQMAKYIPMSKL